MLAVETVVLALAALYLPRRLRNEVPRRALWLLFALALWLRLTALRFWPVSPQSDFALYEQCARQYAAVPFAQWGTVHPGPYLESQWPVLMPFVLLEGVVLRLFHGDARALQVIGALCQSGVCVLLALVGEKVCRSRKRGFLAGCLWAALPAGVLYAPTLTNQHPAMLFLWLGLWLLVTEKPALSPAAGACLALSQLLRPEATVAVLACGLCCIGFAAAFPQKRRRMLLCALGCVLSYWALIWAADAWLLKTGLISGSIRQSHLDYKLLVGCNPESLGRWNASDAALEGAEAIRQALKERLGLKLLPLWGVKLFLNVFDLYNPFLVPDGMQVLAAPFTWLMALLYLGMLPVILRALRQLPCFWQGRGKAGLGAWLLAVCLLGYLAAYTLLETQGRYLFVDYPFWILLSLLPKPCPPGGSLL